MEQNESLYTEETKVVTHRKNDKQAIDGNPGKHISIVTPQSQESDNDMADGAYNRIEEKMKGLEETVRRLTVQVPISCECLEDENGNPLTLEGQIMRHFKKEQRGAVDDSRQYVDYRLERESMRADQKAAQMLNKALQPLEGVAGKLEDVTALRLGLAALDAGLKARGREIFDLRQAAADRYANKTQLDEIFANLQGRATAEEVAAIRAEVLGLRKEHDSTADGLHGVQQATAQAQGNSQALASKLEAQLRECKGYTDTLRREFNNNTKNTEAETISKYNEVLNGLEDVNKKLGQCFTAAEADELRTHVNHFVRDDEIITLRHQVLPACAMFEEQVNSFTLDNQNVRETIRSFDEILCQKANKTKVAQVEKWVEDNYYPMKSLKQLIQEQTQRALLREAEATQLTKSIQDFQAHLEGTINKTVCEIVGDKLLQYESVSASFAQFFNADDLGERLDDKVDMKVFRGCQEGQATKTDLSVVEEMVEAVNNRLKQLSILQAEVAKAIVPTFNHVEGVNSKIQSRDYLAKQSIIASRWITDTPLRGDASLKKVSPISKQKLKSGLRQHSPTKYSNSILMAKTGTNFSSGGANYLQALTPRDGPPGSYGSSIMIPASVMESQHTPIDKDQRQGMPGTRSSPSPDNRPATHTMSRFNEERTYKDLQHPQYQLMRFRSLINQNENHFEQVNATHAPRYKDCGNMSVQSLVSKKLTEKSPIFDSYTMDRLRHQKTKSNLPHFGQTRSSLNGGSIMITPENSILLESGNPMLPSLGAKLSKVGLSKGGLVLSQAQLLRNPNIKRIQHKKNNYSDLSIKIKRGKQQHHRTVQPSARTPEPIHENIETTPTNIKTTQLMVPTRQFQISPHDLQLPGNTGQSGIENKIILTDIRPHKTKVQKHDSNQTVNIQQHLQHHQSTIQNKKEEIMIGPDSSGASVSMVGESI